MKRYIKNELKLGSWDEMAQIVEKSVFRINAGNSRGTCFVVSIGENNDIYETTLITALHVVDGIKQTDTPELFNSNGERIYDKTNHEFTIAKYGERGFDTAAMSLVSNKKIISKDQLLPINKSKNILNRGTEIGWLGYPGLADTELCFFHGYISCYDEKNRRYFVDGSVSPGVSGGPAFTKDGRLIGLVSAYVNLKEENGNKVMTPGLISMVSLADVRGALENHSDTEVI